MKPKKRRRFVSLFRAARRMIESAARDERDPERLKRVILAGVQEAHL
jgi:hypothetical protein